MEVIKTSSNVEFDVIYADGTRKQIALRPEAFDLVKQFFAPMLSAFIPRYGTRSLIEDVPNIVAISRSDCDMLHRADSSRQQAIFRLGQMDMRESAAAKLRSAAANVYGIARATLESAADLIERMETLNSETGQEEMNAEN